MIPDVQINIRNPNQKRNMKQDSDQNGADLRKEQEKRSHMKNNPLKGKKEKKEV